MPIIERFRVEGLAGRTDVCTAELTPYVNVCFGKNGSGKTSLLRIFHSALSNDAGLAKDVPFTKAEVDIYSFASKRTLKYKLDKASGATTNSSELLPANADPNTRIASLLLKGPTKEPKWECDPGEPTGWFHKYLPISRLYASVTPKSTISSYRSSSEREEALEARFSDRINDLWSEYTANVARRINEVQEDGLAKILESVISPSESNIEESAADVKNLYKVVSQFLSRRGIKTTPISANQFTQKYRKDSHFRSVAQHIDTIEKGIADATAPRDRFREIVNGLFQGQKLLVLKDTTIEIEARGAKIALSSLSSGEKQLLRMLVDLLATGPGIILIDEPELSMHVDWQRRLVPTMVTLNSSAQKIFATHSPEIMAELQDNEIFQI